MINTYFPAPDMQEPRHSLGGQNYVAGVWCHLLAHAVLKGSQG